MGELDLFGLAILVSAAGFVLRVVRSQREEVPPGLQDPEVEADEALSDRPWRTVAGTGGALRVRIRSVSRVDLSEGEVVVTTVEVAGAPRTVSIHAEERGPAAERPAGALLAGDPEFDAAIVVQGPEPHLRAVLDRETRARILRLFKGRVDGGRGPTVRAVAGHVRLDGGVIRATLNRAMEHSLRHDGPGDVARAMADVAMSLQHPEGALVKLLARNAREDPCAGVRRGALAALLDDHARDPAAIEARQAALSDPDARVRLTAARADAAEGRETLIALATDAAVDDHIGAEAAAHFDAQVSGVRLSQALTSAVAGRRWATVGACVARARTSRARETASALLDLVHGGREPVASEAADALAALGDADAEPTLHAALASVSPALRAASARALGAVGTVACVPSLRDLEGSDPDRAVRRAAREAVAAVQARLTGASPGQIALAGDADGRVSVADDMAGRVSKADPRDSA